MSSAASGRRHQSHLLFVAQGPYAVKSCILVIAAGGGYVPYAALSDYLRLGVVDPRSVQKFSAEKRVFHLSTHPWV